jgi:large subunit ribosomal protein L21
MFAVVKISGKQYAVTPGMQIDVDQISGNDGETITLEEVLLRDSDKKIVVGEPLVKGAKVTATIVKQYLGEKINVRRYKSKVRHRRSIGFRAHLTKLQINEII